MTGQVAVFVSNGRTVQTDGERGAPAVNNGPGTMIKLEAVEADRLLRLGFVQMTPPTVRPPAPANPAGIGRRDAGDVQGPVYDPRPT
jgi:hypothetical protein